MTNIIDVNYKDEMESSYIDYAMSVIVNRALPDIRDGLKPVQRRILYSMYGLNKNKNEFKKSARIVGDVLGKYHPHGDSSVYDAMVRMAQPFSFNHPLIKGQGNFGSIDGDSAAAMRYTEAKLEGISKELMKGLNKNAVDFTDNFDQSLKEPEVLPVSFCNLLVNGSEGIAVGMATSIPPHNLNEVNNACKAYLNKKDITSRGLTRYITGPDFPTGGIVTNKSDLKEIYEKGRGTVKVRAKIEREKLSGGRHNLVVTEIPYTFAGNKTRLLEHLIDLMENKKLNELSDIRDESSKDGIRIVLETKRGVNLDDLENKLFSETRLEDTVNMNLLAIVDGKPEVLSLKDIISKYMEFVIETYKRRITFDLNNYTDRAEVLNGLIKATDSIDLIIEIIRGSKDVKTAKKVLMSEDVDSIEFKTKKAKNEAKRLKFTSRQADAILQMQLQRLVGLEINKLEKELKEVNKNIDLCNKLLNDEKELNKVIIKDLDNIKDEHGRYRKTKLADIKTEKWEEEQVVEEVYVLIDRFNYVKVLDYNSFSRADTSDYKVLKVMSDESIYLFTNTNKSIQLKLKNMPLNKMSDRGKPLNNKMSILASISSKDLEDAKILFITKLGRVKIVEGKEFVTNRSKIMLSKTRKNDEVVNVIVLSDDDKELVLETNDKRAIRFNLEEVSVQGRMGTGVVGINLNKEDYVVNSYVEGKTDKEKRKRGGKGWVFK